MAIDGAADGEAGGAGAGASSASSSSSSAAAGGRIRKRKDGGADDAGGAGASASASSSAGDASGGPGAHLTATPGYSSAHVPKTDVVGYIPLRGDFDVEHDNDAEAVIADMDFVEGEHATETELKLKILEIYNAKLDERERRKVRESVVVGRTDCPPVLHHRTLLSHTPNTHSLIHSLIHSPPLPSPLPRPSSSSAASSTTSASSPRSAAGPATSARSTMHFVPLRAS
jgi:hypothetical protein